MYLGQTYFLNLLDSCSLKLDHSLRTVGLFLKMEIGHKPRTRSACFYVCVVINLGRLSKMFWLQGLSAWEAWLIWIWKKGPKKEEWKFREVTTLPKHFWSVQSSGVVEQIENCRRHEKFDVIWEFSLFMVTSDRGKLDRGFERNPIFIH